MGVKKCTHLLSKSLRGNFKDFRRKIIVIDAMPIIYRMAIGTHNTGKYIINCYGQNVIETYIIFKIAIRFLSDSIIPIFVFDSVKPNNKANILNRRKKLKQSANEKKNNMDSKCLETDIPVFHTQQEYNNYIKYVKNSYTINKHNLNLAKFLLKWMGLPVIDAPSEADSQCAAIASMYSDTVIGVLSDDSDLLLYGSINIIKLNSLQSNYFDRYTLSNILLNIENKVNNIVKNSTDIELKNKYTSRIKINYNNLVEIGCLMGTDYCNGIRFDFKQKTSINDILTLYIKQDMNIRTLLSSIKNISPVYITKLLNTIDIYKEAKIIHPQNIDINMNMPNINMIRYICNDFIERRSLNNAINIIHNAYLNISKNINRPIHNKHLPQPKYLENIAICDYS